MGGDDDKNREALTPPRWLAHLSRESYRRLRQVLPRRSSRGIALAYGRAMHRIRQWRACRGCQWRHDARDQATIFRDRRSSPSLFFRCPLGACLAVHARSCAGDSSLRVSSRLPLCVQPRVLLVGALDRSLGFLRIPPWSLSHRLPQRVKMSGVVSPALGVPKRTVRSPERGGHSVVRLSRWRGSGARRARRLGSGEPPPRRRVGGLCSGGGGHGRDTAAWLRGGGRRRRPGGGGSACGRARRGSSTCPRPPGGDPKGLPRADAPAHAGPARPGPLSPLFQVCVHSAPRVAGAGALSRPPMAAAAMGPERWSRTDYGQRWGEGAARCFSLESDAFDDDETVRPTWGGVEVAGCRVRRRATTFSVLVVPGGRV